mmetsp:Transcript_23629/g.65716  ORF Transcript_23629/g.65716 Transcript_23629/m.65716 type:complete len:106 (+) Transcript_23629:484-801(+)
MMHPSIINSSQKANQRGRIEFAIFYITINFHSNNISAAQASHTRLLLLKRMMHKERNSLSNPVHIPQLATAARNHEGQRSSSTCQPGLYFMSCNAPSMPPVIRRS